MRKFLLIFAFSFSLCVHAQTNIVQLTASQWNYIQQLCNLIASDDWGYSYIENGSNGSFVWDDGLTDFQDFLLINQLNQQTLVEFLHLVLTGTIRDSYDVSTNNILAYASSLRSHNENVRYYLNDLSTDSSYLRYTLLPSLFSRQNDFINLFHVDTTNSFQLIYDAITNIDLNVSISNNIEMLQYMSGNSNNLDNILKALRDWRLVWSQEENFLNQLRHEDHEDLMDFLHSLSNSVLFASNLCNCCAFANSNYQDSVLAMLEWMTNSFPDVAESPIFGGGGGSNSVWTVWHPSEPLAGGWDDLLVPDVRWLLNQNDSYYHPEYSDNQYDTGYHSLWLRYSLLLENYRAGGITGQEFFSGLVDLQLHIIANMSTQLYMIDSKMPTKTNLWDWIEAYKREVSDAVVDAQRENSEMVSTVSSLLDYTPFGKVGGYFPKVSLALSGLRVDNDASPVVRIPIPRALRVSDSDELVVDVRDGEWYSTGRGWCRWIFTFVWGWLFIRLGLVPIFYAFFFTLRAAEIAAHLVFLGSVRGSSGIVSSFGASAVDLVFSLLGIDTDFKRFVWGIMRD